MFAYFTWCHTNSCKFQTVTPIFKCFASNVICSFGNYCTNFCALTSNFKSLKMGQNLHANMEGFRWPSHICVIKMHLPVYSYMPYCYLENEHFTPIRTHCKYCTSYRLTFLFLGIYIVLAHKATIKTVTMSH